ncbi:hypothetical protein NBT05_00965 [Aquimarina sp. ERC-38]|uniref:DUF6624 domain-containing protein n=1 Tax=Aquimarina sp. ERC-38 TaxID=2949996 RepID=UPI002246F5DC|nr:DUF6624 domain-containing protein [Aquimarina sp. ERC-38]UZO81061.1 hypothetical protein NBT05_00965 [Aquimarina sp. ERC-38]
MKEKLPLYWIIFYTLILVGCDNNLIEVEDNDIVFMIRSNTLDLSKANFFIKNKETDLITFYAVKDSFGVNYYKDKEGVIKKVVLTPNTYKDDLLQFQTDASKPAFLDSMLLKNVDCNEFLSILPDIFERDQKSRTSGLDIKQHDSLNQIKIIPFLEKCGIPSPQKTSFKGMLAIFLTIQHSDKEIISYYYPMFECATMERKMSKSILAFMQDRLMVHNNKDQIYGTQKAAIGKFEILNKENVNKRRAEMGMKPIKLDNL